MQSIQLTRQIGKDGILSVQMPPESKNSNLEVIIIFNSSHTILPLNVQAAIFTR